MSRLDVVLPLLELLLRLIEQVLAQQIISVEATFPSQVRGAVQVQNVSEWYVTITTALYKYEVQQYSRTFFLCCVEESK